MSSLRLAIRSLLRTPVLSFVVVVSLGLGIGANTAIFSFLHQMLLRSLPVPNPSELVALHSPGDLKGGRNSTDDSGDMDSIFSYPAFRSLERQARGVRGVAGYRATGANLAFHGVTTSGSVLMTSGGYFPVLGVQPMLGRTLTWDDDRGSGQPVAVLGYGYWKEKLGAQTSVLNQAIRVNGQVFTIVGVLPKGFTGISFTQDTNVYVPMVFKAAMTPGWDGRERWDDYWIYVFSRLEPGSTIARAQAALNSTYSGIVAEEAKVQENDRGAAYLKRLTASRLWLEEAKTGQSVWPAVMRAPLLILMACTALVLLIAAGNAANLLLARAVQRTKEMAIRKALGAGRLTIIRQFLTEAMVLAVAGCLLGLLLGAWTLSGLIAMVPADWGSFVAPALEWPVMWFAVAISLFTGVLFGLYPAWAGSRVEVSGTLKDESNQSSATRGGVRVRKILVTAQMTLALLLLIPMGLLLKSMVNLMHVDLGFNTEKALVFAISPDLNGYKPESIRAMFERVEQDLTSIPGVRSATAATTLQPGNGTWGSDIGIDGKPLPKGFDSNARYDCVGAGFFGKMGTPLINGREFTEADSPAGPRVVVVNQAFARHFFKNENPIGHRVEYGPDNLMQIVGVVKDAHTSVRESAPRMFYMPYRQQKDLGGMYFYVRTALPIDGTVAQIRRVMRAVDPNLPLVDLRSLDEQVSLNIAMDRLVMQLVAAFAVLATLLAMLGLYGVMAYGVNRRRREFGIRMALGAGAGNIRGLVMREVGVILAVGIVVGVPSAIALSKLVESQLFGVKSFDLSVVIIAVLSLCGAGLLAGYVPALAASRVDPQRALHYE